MSNKETRLKRWDQIQRDQKRKRRSKNFNHKQKTKQEKAYKRERISLKDKVEEALKNLKL
jgi:hypothetical protein